MLAEENKASGIAFDSLMNYETVKVVFILFSFVFELFEMYILLLFIFCWQITFIRLKPVQYFNNEQYESARYDSVSLVDGSRCECIIFVHIGMPCFYHRFDL
jgi:hypothetical protein